jgi:hypothetical protein
MFKRIVLVVMLALASSGANAACNPSDAPPNSVGCQPALPSAVQATDLFLGWRPSLGKTASRTITPAQLLQAGLPGGFSSLSASGSATVLGTLTVGDTTPLTGGSKFFRFGYGATNPLVTMQSAGTDSTGAAQQVLSISQQVTHTGAGGAGAIGALYSASTIDGAPYQDYYAAAFTMTNRALRLGGATPDQAQHGTLFTHQVKALPTAGFNPGDVMADSWVQWWVMQDRTNLPSSQGGALVGVEFDIFGNNQDDAPTKKRFARQVVLNNYASDAAHPLEWGYGDYWNSFTGGAQDTFFNVVSAYYAGWTVAAIDLSQGTGSRANPYVDATNRGVDIKMRDGGKLGFNGDGATGSYMTHGTSRFQYWAGGSERASISDTGVGIIGGGTAPFTLSNGTLSVPSSQNMAIQLASAGTSISLGATSAGLGNVLTITPNSNGNSFFGSVPNDVTIPNRLTVGQLRSSGGTFACLARYDWSDRDGDLRRNLRGGDSGWIVRHDQRRHSRRLQRHLYRHCFDQHDGLVREQHDGRAQCGGVYGIRHAVAAYCQHDIELVWHACRWDRILPIHLHDHERHGGYARDELRGAYNVSGAQLGRRGKGQQGRVADRSDSDQRHQRSARWVGQSTACCRRVVGRDRLQYGRHRIGHAGGWVILRHKSTDTFAARRDLLAPR